jgi:hypothetical protein
MKYDNQQKSLTNFKIFTYAFGQPTSATKENEGFNNYEWRINDVQIVHYVFDRFGRTYENKKKLK